MKPNLPTGLEEHTIADHSGTMQEPNEAEGLTGKLLIAMPGMGDPRFEHSVVFICAHSDDGAMGLIINKPAAELQFNDLLDQLDIPKSDDARQISVHFGGPVENGRGFVLHSSDYDGNDSTLKVSDTVGMTATLDILEDISRGSGPSAAFLALGYAGWGPGQLEAELQNNGWLTSDAPLDLLFDPDAKPKWERALAILGIDPLLLSATGGRA
jgi:putative transcriptional regulator